MGDSKQAGGNYSFDKCLIASFDKCLMTSCCVIGVPFHLLSILVTPLLCYCPFVRSCPPSGLYWMLLAADCDYNGVFEGKENGKQNINNEQNEMHTSDSEEIPMSETMNR